MVTPLRSIFYGIPILVVGVLAALPFRRVPEPSEVIEQPASVDDWAVAPIRELSDAEIAAWEQDRDNDLVDPMQSLAESMPAIADSYQAVAVPLKRPAKITDRFSAVARDSGVSSNRRDSEGPLAGHPAALVSTGVRRSADSAESTTGWNTGIPIGRPASDHEPRGDAVAFEQLAGKRDRPSSQPPLKAAPAEASSILPPPRPKQGQDASSHKDSQPSEEPWPTLAELASKKQAKKSNEKAPRTEEPMTQASSSDRGTDEDRSASGVGMPTSRFSDLEDGRSSSHEKNEDTKGDRQRFFIREPTSGRG